MGFNQKDDKVIIKAKYYAMDKKSSLYMADIYIQNKAGDYIKLENSDFNTRAKTITLTDVNNRLSYEIEAGKVTYNTWNFDTYLPYQAKAVPQGENLELLNNNTFDYKLLVVLDIIGVKADGRVLGYTAKEDEWATENGQVYGKNKPTKLKLLGIGPNNGEVFWYNLYETALEDFELERKW